MPQIIKRFPYQFLSLQAQWPEADSEGGLSNIISRQAEAATKSLLDVYSELCANASSESGHTWERNIFEPPHGGRGDQAETACMGRGVPPPLLIPGPCPCLTAEILPPRVLSDVFLPRACSKHE